MVKAGKNDFNKSEGYGTVKIASVAYGGPDIVHLHNILYAPELAYNLTSLSQARKQSCH